MAFGLGRLGWAPQQFWSATPQEIAAALSFHAGAVSVGAPDRDALTSLMAAHPDLRADAPATPLDPEETTCSTTIRT
jgi:uncharacterized phage protein (TIGR02216 family)